ncbi:MAG: class I SAM-dependent methyltransferase [Dehalococcoidia bacterium]
MTTNNIDQAKAEAFAQKMMDAMTGGSLSLMLSVGHRTGLLDKMADLPPSTSEEIAHAAGLNERYVREWLGGVTTGGVVEYDAATKRYRLPPEHAAFVTRAAGPDNFAFLMQYIAVLGDVEGKIVECFEKGGGVPYSDFPRFVEVQREETARVYDLALVDGILPVVPGITQQLEAGIDVADIGCGGGRAINVMAKAFPKSRFTGFDLLDESIGFATTEAKEWGLTNARFEARNVTDLGETEAFDFITAFDAIHDQAQPRKVLANIATALRPSGVFLLADIAASSDVAKNIDNPWAPLFYTWSTFHCMTVSLAYGGEGLGTCWGEELAKELLAEAGFSSVQTTQVEGDPINIYYICRK